MPAYQYQITVYPKGTWTAANAITAITVDFFGSASVDLLATGTQISGRTPVGGQIAGSDTANSEDFIFTYDSGAVFPESFTVVSPNSDLRFLITIYDPVSFATIYQGVGIYSLAFQIPSVPARFVSLADYNPALMGTGSRVKFNGTMGPDGAISQTSPVAGFAGLSSTFQAGPDVYLAENSAGKKELMMVNVWRRTSTIWSDVMSDGRGFDPGISHPDLIFTRTSLDPDVLAEVTKPRGAPLTVRGTRCRHLATDASPGTMPLFDPNGLFSGTFSWDQGAALYVGGMSGPRYAMAECRMYVGEVLVLYQRVCVSLSSFSDITRTDYLRNTGITSDFTIESGDNGPSDINCNLLSPPASSVVTAVMDVVVTGDEPLFRLTNDQYGTNSGPAWFTP